MVDIEVVQLDPGLPVPTYAREDDAGADLPAREDVLLAAAGGRGLVATGVSVAIPPGWAGLVLPRSGLALRHGVTCLNAPGLVDAGYRDEIKILLVNTDPERDYQVCRGDRIGQLVIQRVEAVRFRPVDELAGTQRGRGGFGHSGR